LTFTVTVLPFDLVVALGVWELGHCGAMMVAFRFSS
jgi:hypothetical protein